MCSKPEALSTCEPTCEPTVFQSALFKPYATKARMAKKTTEDDSLLDDVPLYITRTGKFLSTNEMRKRKRTVNCKHWLRGFCKYGDACNFAHPTKQEEQTRCTQNKAAEEEKDALPVEFTAHWRDQQADDACIMPIARRVHQNLGPDVGREDFREALDHKIMSWAPRNHVFRLIESIGRVSDRVMRENRKPQKRKRRRKRKRISGAMRHARNSENRTMLDKVRAVQASQVEQAVQVELESFPDLDASDDVFDSACEDDADDLLCVVQKSQTLGESQFAARKAEPANPLNFLLNA